MKTGLKCNMCDYEARSRTTFKSHISKIYTIEVLREDGHDVMLTMSTVPEDREQSQKYDIKQFQFEDDYENEILSAMIVTLNLQNLNLFLNIWLTSTMSVK